MTAWVAIHILMSFINLYNDLLAHMTANCGKFIDDIYNYWKGNSFAEETSRGVDQRQIRDLMSFQVPPETSKHNHVSTSYHFSNECFRSAETAFDQFQQWPVAGR